MKLLLILALIVTTVATPRAVLADETNQTDESSQPVEKSSKPKKKSVPPGLQKKGGLPPGQAKKQPEVPKDVLITNAPMTNVVVRPTVEKPKVDDKRVESPRGSEALPVWRPEDTNKVAKPKPETASKGQAAVPTAKQEKELESELLRINASWINLKSRPTALQKIAHETGATVEQLNEQASANSKLDGGSLLMANKIAALTSRAPADVYAAHKGRIRWLTTGSELGADPRLVHQPIPIIALARFIAEVAYEALHVRHGHAEGRTRAADDIFLDHDAAEIVCAVFQRHLPDVESLRDPRALHARKVVEVDARERLRLEIFV
jgi:hypothetical protein